jgi:tetratricopeptide (TPR) repeat protein
MATKNYKEAPFFYTLALRFDPLNTDAIVGIAKSVANTEGIDRGISQLQDELQKSDTPRAEILAAIAELQIQKGEWDAAQSFVDQAIAANADYAQSYRLQAQIYMNQETSDKKAVDKALAALRAFTDRNRSDASGYLERYRIFLRKGLFEQANDELSQIYSVYPKYPNLHYYKGQLYSIMGNYRVAVDEFSQELKFNPTSIPTMVELGKAMLEGRQSDGDLVTIKAAADLFTKAMQMAPQASEPKHQAGYAAYLQKNYTAAVALLNAAAAGDRGNPEIFKRLGQAYREMGDAANARANFKRYLDLRPDAPDKSEIERFL